MRRPLRASACMSSVPLHHLCCRPRTARVSVLGICAAARVVVVPASPCRCTLHVPYTTRIWARARLICVYTEMLEFLFGLSEVHGVSKGTESGMAAAPMTTSAVARVLKRSEDMVRYYERTGRLAATRTSNGMRL